MRKIVIMPGGFHPFHAGHAALYKSAVTAFNDADVYVAATNDTKTRPFPFAIKEKLAKLAGVADKHFIQVKSPFQPREITDHYNPEEDVLIFVRSEKDRNESPKPGGTKKDGTPAYFQPWTGKNVQPFGKQAYIAYLPTVEFGPGITSATEIRNAWPTLNDKRKTAMVMSLYPVTQKNPKLADNVVKMLDMGMGNELAETIKKVEPISPFVPIQQTIIQPKQHVHNPLEKKTTPAVVNHIKPKEVKEFAPPSGDGGGENERSRRIRKLLEIAIQVAKEKNVDELGMIHAMNMIAGDDFFNTAVEGILPDITDKEYMFVLQSAYKTVKQGLAEGKRKKKSRKRSLGRYFFPGYSYYGGSGESGEGGGDGGGEGVAEGDVVPFKQPSKTLTWQQVPRDILLLANDWFWASEDNSGLAATIDPEGFGNGTANDVKYLTAKLQQKGWTIDFNDEYDGPGEFNLRLTNKRGQTILLPIEDAQTFTGWAKGTSQYDLEEGPVVKRIVNPTMINIYVRPGGNKPPLLVATDIPYKIFDKYVNKAIQKYPQFKQTDFSFKSSDKITEFAPPGSNDREPDEEKVLRKLAAQWWNGTEQQMIKAERTLEAMGWEIGQDESGDDDAGVFVIRAGDENGDTYIAFTNSELQLDEVRLSESADYLEEK